MTTVKDIIKSSLRLIGVTASGEEPTPEELRDSLEALNLMLDSWSTENLMIYSTQDQMFIWPTNRTSQTLGPTGDFVGSRPVRLLESTYFKDIANGISYPITQINEEQYNRIASKTATSEFPVYILIDATMPNITMSLYPVPTKELEFHFVSAFELKVASSYEDVLLFPPGYERAFKYNLACELAPEFGVGVSNEVNRISMVSKRNIKRINKDDSLMEMPEFLAAKQFNIYSGDFR
jgi:hypothetical protein